MVGCVRGLAAQRYCPACLSAGGGQPPPPQRLWLSVVRAVFWSAPGVRELFRLLSSFGRCIRSRQKE